MFSPTMPPREGGSIPEIYNVTIASPGADGATIILPGQTAATRKAYPYAIAGMQLAAGDRALALKISGTYVILGGAVSGGGLPPGGAIYDALVKRSAAAGDAVWTPLLYRGADGGLCEVDEL